MNPTVSVIIPTFNRAHLVGQAIDSVLQQTYTDYEVLVVDDGSTDGTGAVVEAYGDRVRCVRTANGGIGRARNIGAHHARGDLLTFLDSDDLLYPYALDLQTRVLDRFPDAAFVCAEMSAFDEGGFLDRYHLKTYHRSAYRNPALTYERIFESSIPLAGADLLPQRLIDDDPGAIARRAYVGNIFDTYVLNIVICQTGVLLRRAILPAVGRRNERLKYWEEVDFLLRICRQHQVCFVDVPTYKQRYHDGQISTTAGADGKYIWMRKQQALLGMVKRHALGDVAYYERRRTAVDEHLAHLHRAVAVPMMLAGTGAASTRRYARRARVYLARCRRHGHHQWTLWLLSFMPGPIRRLGVTIVQRLSRARFSGVRRRGPVPS